MTINGGTNWTNITGTLPAYPVDALVMYYSGSTRVVVAKAAACALRQVRQWQCTIGPSMESIS